MLVTLLLALSVAHADVRGLSVSNASVVLKSDGTVLRGAAPVKKGQADELAKLGVTDVVIFKNETGHEVKDEIAALTDAGIDKKHITAIPFKWKDIASYKTACEQTVQALKILDTVAHSSDRKAFFHCTAGEDRTGMLAGLLKMLESGVNVRDAFERELCAHGYEAGNRGKPAQVVSAIRKELTPVFLKVAALIKSGKLSPGHLSKSACATEPSDAEDPADFKCGK